MEIKTGKRVVAYSFFGGKAPHLVWLFSKFPSNVHLVDAMCGSGSVGINADCRLVTLNDWNSDVYNFFKVFRNRPREFLRVVKYTPFSREEFEKAATPCTNELEKARRFFVRAMQGFAGLGSQSEGGGWGYEVSPLYHYNGKDRNHFRVDTWKSKLAALEIIADRLREMQIEHMPVLKILQVFDRPRVLIYLDPPYLRSVRYDKPRYRIEFTDQDHIDMLKAASKCKCYVAISCYDSELYDRYLDPKKWFKSIGLVKRSNTMKRACQEILYTNYNPDFSASKSIICPLN